MDHFQDHIKQSIELIKNKYRTIILIVSVMCFILLVFALSANRSERALSNELKRRSIEFEEKIKKNQNTIDSLEYEIFESQRRIQNINQKLKDEKDKFRKILDSPDINDPDSLRNAILRAARKKVSTEKDGVLYSGGRK